MMQLERQKKILDYLNKNRKATTKELSQLLDVSTTTIRTDLNQMDRENLITKTHGGAVYNDRSLDNIELTGRAYFFDERALENQKEKEMIQSMVSDIAHQVRTPAANLKMFAEILGRKNLSEERKKQFFTMMEAQTEKINFLMDAMTKMSRLETGLVSLHQKRQSLLDTLAEAMSEVMPKAMKKGITVTVSCPEETELIHDRRWTVEAVFNLLDNAVKYTDQGGKIKIDVNQGQFYTKINISDTGRGIAAEHLNKIFQRFYREPEAEGEEGIGLGLHLAKEIIELEKGYISVAAVVGEGTTFSVYLLNEPDSTVPKRSD